MADTLELTTQIVSAHVAKNPVEPNQLSQLIKSVFEALTKAGELEEQLQKFEPAVPVKKSVFNDHLVCLECGGSFKILKRHLQTDHDLTIEQYRGRFGLPRDYPVVAPDYAERRSSLAKEIGLGRAGVRVKKTGRKRA